MQIIFAGDVKAVLIKFYVYSLLFTVQLLYLHIFVCILGRAFLGSWQIQATKKTLPHLLVGSKGVREVRLPQLFSPNQGRDIHLLMDTTKTLFGSSIFVFDSGDRMGASQERPCCTARSKDNGHSG